MIQDLANHIASCDRGNDASSAAALRTNKNVKLEHTAQQIRPRVVRPHRGRGKKSASQRALQPDVGVLHRDLIENADLGQRKLEFGAKTP